MAKVLQARIYPDESGGYCASCEVVHAYTQGIGLDETLTNLKEAIALALEGEDLSDFGLEPGFSLSVTIEIPAAINAWTEDFVR